MPRFKKIVCLGGGNAMPQAVLAGLKNYPVKITAVSATLDTGGSAGRLRAGFGGISFGDIRRAVLALSEADKETKNYFAYRDWDGHVMANVFCAGMMVATNSPEKTINSLSKRLKVPVKHQILPVTLDDANICATLENGKTIFGETSIDIPKHKSNLKIKKVYLKPKAKAYPAALKAIKEADLVVIGPGDIYSTLSHILLVEGVAQALRRSKAKKVYVCNLMTKNGETNSFALQDFPAAIEKLMGQNLDFIVYNTKKPSTQRLINHKKNYPVLLDLVEGKTDDKRFVGADLLVPFGPVVHDSAKLAKVIIKLCRQ